MRLPLFGSLAGYERSWLRGDLVAGLTVWAVLVPEALAYASIAGVSPVVGLYAAPAALLFYAAFGSSRHLVTGPMAATAALSAAAVADLSPAGANEFAALTVTLALTVGVIAFVAGLLRLGFLASFISEPVLKGFIVGLALTIIVGQVPKLLGVEKEGDDFFDQLWHLLGNVGGTSGLTLLVGLASLALVVVLKERAPVVPGSLVAVLLGILAVRLFDLDEHGVSIVGDVDSGLPSLGLPDVGWRDYLDIAPASIGVMLVGFAEGLGAAKTYATRNHYDVDPNRELLGLGAANIAAGLSSGMVVNGSLSKTAVNGSAGAKSQVSGLIVAVLTVVTLLFLTGLFETLPEATLAAVVIAALVELVDVRALRELFRVRSNVLGRVAARPDFVAAIAALRGRSRLRHASGPLHRNRRVAAPPSLPGVEAARRDPGPGTGRADAVDRSRAPPGERAGSRGRRASSRSGSVLCQRRLGAEPHPGERRGHQGDRARRREHALPGRERRTDARGADGGSRAEGRPPRGRPRPGAGA